MNHISQEDILTKEIQLLESSGKTLTTLHKHLLIGGPDKGHKLFF
jgi:hypothetical protein